MSFLPDPGGPTFCVVDVPFSGSSRDFVGKTSAERWLLGFAVLGTTFYYSSADDAWAFVLAAKPCIPENAFERLALLPALPICISFALQRVGSQCRAVLFVAG